MARRKKKDDEPEWVPPDFDEVGYMRQEIQGAHAAMATIGWAVLGAVVALLLYSVLPVLAFFAGIAVGFGMYFIFPMIGIKTDAFKRRDWIGHGISYFFSWLAFWILLLNPPFSDHTDPTIQGISVSPTHNGYTGPLACSSTSVAAAGLSMGSNTSILIMFRATDNVGLANVTVDVVPGGAVIASSVSGQANRCLGQSGEYLPGAYGATFANSGASSYAVTLTAVDTSGHTTVAGLTISPTP